MTRSRFAWQRSQQQKADRPFLAALALAGFALLGACTDIAAPPPAQPLATSFSVGSASDYVVCGASSSAVLVAGQQHDAGVVTVENNDQTLRVTIETAGGWTLKETHVAIAGQLSGIPTNRSGNPVPGQFAHKASHASGSTSHSVTVTLAELGVAPGEAVIVAAHADVASPSGKAEGAWGAGTRFVARGNWATYSSHSVQECRGDISGRVVDDWTGAAIGGASVSVDDGSSIVATVLSAADGSFLAEDVLIGTYSVTASATDYHSASATGVVVTPNQTTAAGDIALVPHTGKITGRVVNEATGAAIGGATVQVSDGSSVVATLTSASDGTFTSADLRVGGYTLTASASGFQTATVSGISVTNGATTDLGDVELTPNSGAITGTVVNALSGSPLGGATVELRQGSLLIASTTTNGSGGFGPLAAPAGAYTLSVSLSGYITATSSVTISAGTTSSVGQIALSPVLSAGEIRIVLTWGQYPTDLDSHLTGPYPSSTSRFHVYYGNRGSLTSSPYAYLDVDDVSSYGPETITITQQSAGTYRYSVHNYSYWNGNLSTSGGRVRVYSGSSQIAEFNVPNGSGGIWTVFELNGGTLTPINTVGSASFSLLGGSGDVSTRTDAREIEAATAAADKPDSGRREQRR